MVFKAPYCTDSSLIVIPGIPPAASPLEHAERTGKLFSIYFPNVRLTGPGCWEGGLLGWTVHLPSPFGLCSHKCFIPALCVSNAAFAGMPASSFPSFYSLKKST